LPSIRKNLRPSRAARNPFAFDVGGLAGAGGADDQPRPVLHESGDDDQATLVGPAQVAVDLHAEGDGSKVVVAHGLGPADGRLHAAGGFALLLADLGWVDGLPAPGQVERRGEQAEGDGQGELRPQERSGCRVVQVGGADLAQPTGIAGKVVGQGRPRATLGHDHQGDGSQGGEGEFPPAQAGDAQECLAGRPGQ
jgi:hypothetical protein